MWFIIVILFVIFLLTRSSKEPFNTELEKLPYIRENNIQIEQFKPSHIKDLDIKVDDDIGEDQAIRDIYDAIVDDGRLANQQFDSIDTIDNYEYYSFNNKHDYGATNFSNY
uniref:Uncharacterized protein n=1 Tax=viral metagenome TaxID=1070528 RepID=A0A6C0M000_9ZZZZ